MNSDIITAHSRIAISRELLASGHWSGIRHGVKLDMRLENNLLGRMIVCQFRIGKKPQQITGETIYEVGNALRAQFARQGRI